MDDFLKENSKEITSQNKKIEKISIEEINKTKEDNIVDKIMTEILKIR